MVKRLDLKALGQKSHTITIKMTITTVYENCPGLTDEISESLLKMVLTEQIKKDLTDGVGEVAFEIIENVEE